jgi:hypothetical protein
MQIHPMFAHLNFDLASSRLMRFSSTLFQIYAVVILTLATVSMKEEEYVFTFSDIDYIVKVAFIMALLLLPIVSQPINWVFENKMPRINEGGLVYSHDGKIKQVFKALFVVLS